ncbi:aminodeoxychorismate synthase subunit I [Albidovulum inexpectatum]|uniref:Aminodeoxychorismate synthase subunit I n=1 Tax=Albidovulum inexpectatum TaxID=196587 RepID=A0A2S5JFR0_9RHOB|nr:aminodeoxychorismate synthase component I [Albidovulum inexpectatum]PPB80269.1 aminodeoxychorismate synthase subunit I [Albidovulum inexpectatum]
MILIEDGPSGAPVLFDDAEEIIRADAAAEVPAALARLDAALARGKWVAGLASYELGYALEARLMPLMPEGRRVPLLALGVFGGPRPANEFLRAAGDEAGLATLANITPGWDARRHATAICRILDYIAAGDIYQANLTMRMQAQYRGSARGLYAALAVRQPVRHGALVDLPGMPRILSRSPELFFATTADGHIETRPMKGTAPRHPDPKRDSALRDGLAQSVKNRAENLMIVDLLRNDISRICRLGSVRVPDLYRVETYATVHQMISRVTGRLRDGVRGSEIFRALFPCGSITGAPKIRAMEIIRELEDGPRDAYCGAIGWMAPDGAARFNVAIRTIELYDDGRAEFGVGGGIVADSTPEGEYEEALWKARFADLTRD